MRHRTGQLLGIGLPALLLCLLLGIAAGFGSYVFTFAEGGSYFSTNPQACVNCHVMRDHYDNWAKSSHHAVAVCTDCHMPHETIPKYLVKAENGFWHSTVFTLQISKEPLQIRPHNARVVRDACIHCHKDLVADVVGTGHHGRETLDCIHCHASVGHGAPR